MTMAAAATAATATTATASYSFFNGKWPNEQKNERVKLIFPRCLSIDCNEHSNAIYIKHFINPTVRIFWIRFIYRISVVHFINPNFTW